jgi:hypothetical protein
MPAGDGRGPRGEGPMTGRRAGFCAGGTTPGYASSGQRGMGRGRGGGGRGFFGFPWGFSRQNSYRDVRGQVAPEEFSGSGEVESLRAQNRELLERFTALENRIREMEKSGTGEE